MSCLCPWQKLVWRQEGYGKCVPRGWLGFSLDSLGVGIGAAQVFNVDEKRAGTGGGEGPGSGKEQKVAEENKAAGCEGAGVGCVAMVLFGQCSDWRVSFQMKQLCHAGCPGCHA